MNFHITVYQGIFIYTEDKYMNNDFMQSFFMQNVRTDNNSGKVFYSNFGSEQLIGYTEQAYNELQQIASEAISKAEEYKKMLVDNGLLKEPPKQEDINNQILEQLNNLSIQMKQLNNEVDKIKRGGTNEYNAGIINNRKPKNTSNSKAGLANSEQHAENDTGV